MKLFKREKDRDSSFLHRIKEIKKNGVAFNLLGAIPMVWSLILVLLVVWGVNVALADPNWYLDNSNTFITQKFTLTNFIEAVQKFRQQVSDPTVGMRWVGYWEMFWNSIWYSVGGTFMKMLATVCFAYAVARFEFPGRKVLYAFILLQMMLPVYGQTAANYNLMLNLGILDSPWFLISQGAGHGMYFLISYSFFRNLPTGYVEAAKIDGAGPFTIFWKIMLPMAKPIVIALGIMQLIAYWNDYQNVLVFLKSSPTLSSALYTIKEQAFNLGLQTPSYFAGIFLSILPVAILFIAFNKEIMENVSIGGLKG